jgi:hypothetical protein
MALKTRFGASEERDDETPGESAATTSSKRSFPSRLLASKRKHLHLR